MELSFYHYFPRFTIIIGLLVFSTGIFAQKSDYIYEQFTTIEGLPSNECHEVLEDHEGIIWIGTDNGLVRYDGYEFKVYGEEEGLGEKVIFEIKEDSLGRIWVGGLNSEIFILDRQQDKFQAYEYNSIFKKFKIDDKNLIKLISEFHFKGDTLLVQSIPQNGLIKIDSKGNVSDNKFETNDCLAVEEEDGFFNICSMVTNNKKTIHFSNPEIDTSIYDIMEMKSNLLMAKKIRGVTVFGANKTMLVIRNGNIKKIGIGEIGEISEMKNGFPICFLWNKGVKIFTDDSFENYITLLDEVSATGFIEDRNGGYWISSLTKGIFYIKNPNIKYVNSSSQDIFYKNIESTSDKLYANTREGNIFEIGKEVNTSKFEDNLDIEFLEYDKYRDVLWYCSDIGVITTLNKEYYFNLKNGNAGIKNIQIEENGLKLIHTNGYCSEIDLQTGNTKTIQSNNFLSQFRNTISIGTLEDDLFLGTNNNFYRINKNSIETKTQFNSKKTQSFFKSIEEVPKFENVRVEKIKNGIKDDLLVCTKSLGLGIYISTDSIHFINTDDGLISDYIENVFLDSEGVIWLSTLQGISKIERYWSEDRIITNITQSHGLPSPDVYDITDLNDKMYAATGKGIVEIRKDATINIFTGKPDIISLQVNNDEKALKNNLRFRYDENYVRVDFRTSNYKHKERIVHRYRINNSDWTKTQEEYVLLPKLSPSSYLLEIQAENEDGQWSDSTEIEFRIDKPWWRTIFFIVGLIILGLLIILIIVRNRLKVINNENKLMQEIKNLEKSALSAQMSPHFIFNCLNSIQRYIMDNDKKVAMVYLSKFSNLIRMYLTASVNDKISISDEVKMLDYYLKLEQLRFNSNFDFEISIKDELVRDSIYIPSMIIQPFVENAVLHGMKYKKNADGKIMIEIKKEKEYLDVLIIDNGPGIDSQVKDMEHDSQGMDITQKRLKIIQEKMNVEGAYKVSSSEEGTKIELKIPMSEREERENGGGEERGS